MKIIYVLHTIGLNEGSSKAFLNLLQGVMHHGVEPFVVCPGRGKMYQYLQKNGIKVANCFYRYNTYPPFDKNAKNILLFLPRLFGRIMANTIGTIQLYRMCKYFKPDIIHTNVSVTGIGYYASRLLRIPHVWHIREYGALDFNFHYYCSRRQQLTRYRKIRSYTICITKDIQRYNELNNYCRSRVIYDGVLSAAHTYYNPHKQPYFLFAGRIEKAKGLYEFLVAYAHYCKVCAAPLPLHIAGRELENSDYPQKCHRFIEENNLVNKVHFLGVRTDILSLYQEAQAIIVPSISEGFGFITAEAMFSGCLVVGNDVAGTKEQFDNGKDLTGEEIALRYTELEQLVHHLLEITKSVREHNFQQIYEPMILRAQGVVKQLYTTEQNAQFVYDLYQKMKLENV